MVARLWGIQMLLICSVWSVIWPVTGDVARNGLASLLLSRVEGSMFPAMTSTRREHQLDVRSDDGKAIYGGYFLCKFSWLRGGSGGHKIPVFVASYQYQALGYCQKYLKMPAFAGPCAMESPLLPAEGASTQAPR